MATKEPTPFERVFSKRDLLRGAALEAWLWSVASSILLCAGLVDLFLITDLLAHGGQLRIAAVERDELVGLVGEDLAQGTEPLPAAAAGEISIRDRGLLPTIWHNRSKAWIRPVTIAYRRFKPFRDDTQALATLVALAALMGLCRSMVDSHTRILLQGVALEVATRLRRSIHRQALRLGPSDLLGRSGEQAYELFTAEVDRLSAGLLAWAERIGREPVRLVFLLVLAVVVDWKLALLCSVPMAACGLVALSVRRKIDQERRLADALREKELRLLAEGLEKTRLIRGFGMESFEQEQFQKYLHRFQERIATEFKSRAWLRRGVRTMVAAAVALVLWFVGQSVLLSPEKTELSAGALLVASLGLAWFPLVSLVRLSADRDNADEAAQRIQVYLNLIPEVGQAVGAKFLQPLTRMLTIDNVSYTAPGKRQVLDKFSLKIPAGRQVAIVASDPLESMAVAYLLPRFIEPQSGRILFDNEDIAWVTLESLRAETVFVGGKDPFLTGTVRENISGGSPNYSLQDITEAAKIAHAHNFIQKLGQGYETVLGEHGELLDPGQAFRLGLARAVLRKPAVLVIEEPDAPLDDDTKSMLDDAYKRVSQNRTVLYLPRRLSTLKRADEIVVIHKGRLAAIGPHSRLVQTSALYRHWEYINFNEFRHEFEMA